MIQPLKLFGNFNCNEPYFTMFIVGSQIFMCAPKIFISGAHMAPRKIHEVASLCRLTIWKVPFTYVDMLQG